MYLLCDYSKEEVLTVVAEHASQTLPDGKSGVLRARFKEDGSVEVFFIENGAEVEIEKETDKSELN